MKKLPIVYIEGDGIGPEITNAMRAVVDTAVASSTNSDFEIEWICSEAGKEAYECNGELLPQKTFDAIKEYKIAIKGPTETPTGGGHRSVNVSLRQDLDLYANVRPIRWFKGLQTPIRKPENVNLTIFRESTEDVYSGIEFAAGSDEAHALFEHLKLTDRVPYDSAFGIKPVSEGASKRLMKRAVEFAESHDNKRITVVHKGNIMKFTEGAFNTWCFEEARELLGEKFLSYQDFTEKYDKTIPEGRILVQDRIADAMFQDLLLSPENHEIIVTLNLNGDYLSDASAALVGGLGMAPGANLGDEIALFEAVHGTAPDIAGKNLANPSALILSAVLLFEHIGEPEIGALMNNAIERAINENLVTGDLFSKDSDGSPLTCSQYQEVLCKFIRE